jgi:hypothetical protein
MGRSHGRSADDRSKEESLAILPATHRSADEARRAAGRRSQDSSVSPSGEATNEGRQALKRAAEEQVFERLPLRLDLEHVRAAATVGGRQLTLDLPPLTAAVFTR